MQFGATMPMRHSTKHTYRAQFGRGVAVTVGCPGISGIDGTGGIVKWLDDRVAAPMPGCRISLSDRAGASVAKGLEVVDVMKEEGTMAMAL
jgi:hypothetical protein